MTDPNEIAHALASLPEAATQGQQPQVDVPANAHVHCPLVGFKLRQVSKCMACPHFGGAVQDRFPGAAHLSFAQRYVVPCNARPTQRQIQETE